MLDLDSCQDNSHLRACQCLEVHLNQFPASINWDISLLCVHVRWIFSRKSSLVEQGFPSHVLLFSSSRHVQHRRWQYAGTEGVHLLEEAGPEWELAAAGFFQRKSKQGLECESFRNSIMLLLSGECSYSPPQ